MDGRKIEVETDSFLQTPFWAEVKAAEGWRPYFFDEDGGRILLLVRTLRRYVPFGWGQSAVTPQSAAEKGRRWQRETGEPLFLVKWDFPLYTVFTKEEGIDPQFDFGIGAPLKKAVADIQPPDTTILDLTKSDEELFAAMHRKTRYNIKYAEKSGVRIEKPDITSNTPKSRASASGKHLPASCRRGINFIRQQPSATKSPFTPKRITDGFWRRARRFRKKTKNRALNFTLPSMKAICWRESSFCFTKSGRFTFTALRQMKNAI